MDKGILGSCGGTAMTRYPVKSCVIVILCCMMFGTCFVPMVSSSSPASNGGRSDGVFDGQILFSPWNSHTTYLINSSGAVNHTWPSSYQPFTEAYWLGNGTILRPISQGHGGLQVIRWDGSLAWDWRYTVSGTTCHHDVQVLPNGNVLMIVWVTMARNQAIAAGRNPNTIPSSTFTPDKIIEVHQTGSTTGEVVWEWNIWDHLIQDYDSSKANFGVVGDHPELIDINFGDDFVGDWLHTNSLDYNATFDQILVDVHNFNEFWVIDHSTTTEEAVGHTGGQYGRGGDLLYRWGNPASYRAGTASDRKLFGEHDATWIPSGLPGAGHVLVFNNGWERPDGAYSSVEEIAPPINETGHYYRESGSPYGPEDFTWHYTATPPTSMYSYVFGGALRLADGNTLICVGTDGRFLEVTPDKTVIWEWTNPYPSPSNNDVFLIQYLPRVMQQPPVVPDLDCTGSLSWSDVKPGTTLTGSFQVENSGDSGSLLDWTVNTSSLTWGTWTFTPADGHGLTPEQGPVTVEVSVVAPDEKNTEFQGAIKVQNADNASDFDTIPVVLKTPACMMLPLAHPFFQILQYVRLLLHGFFGYMTK
jgi:hypothetical protein